MKTGANGFNDTGSAFKVILKIILQAAMAHSDLVHVKQEGDTCQPLRGPDHNISVYEGRGHGRGYEFKMLWNATIEFSGLLW